MQRIVITGGSGLLAVNWCLSRKQVDLFSLGLHTRKIKVEGVETFIADLSSADGFKSQLAKLEPDLVVHTVAITSIEQCEENPELAELINTRMAINVAEACSYFNIPLVHISTDQLFSGDKLFFSEEDNVSPLNVYGKTKRMAEIGVLEWNQKSVVVRTNFFGWGPVYRRSFSDFIIDSLRKGKEVNLFNNVYYTPILISELIDGIMQLASKKEYGLFNLVGNERLSKYDFGVKVAHAFGLNTSLIRSVEIASMPGLAKRPLEMSLSNSKANANLNTKIRSMDAFLQDLTQQEAAGFAKAVENVEQ